MRLVGDRRQRFDWKEKDIFALPSWASHSHANASSSEDAVLFSFNDIPAMRALALYREADATSAKASDRS